MLKNKTTPLLFFFLGLLILSSCEKEDTIEKEHETHRGSRNQGHQTCL